MKKLFAMTTAALMMAMCALPAMAKTYAELSKESLASNEAAAAMQSKASELFAKGDQAGGCAAKIEQVKHTQYTLAILRAVKKSFVEGKGTKTDRALFPDLTFTIDYLSNWEREAAVEAAEKGC